jgi:uncharacterized protein (DUF2345 family)
LGALPDSRVNLLGQRFHLVHAGTDMPISFAKYRIISSTGEIFQGVSDEDGYTERVQVDVDATLDIEILHGDQEVVIGDQHA